jgi:hypothetical protein
VGWWVVLCGVRDNWFLVIFCVAVRLIHPLKVGASALVLDAFGIDFFAFCLIFEKSKKNKIIFPYSFAMID